MVQLSKIFLSTLLFFICMVSCGQKKSPEDCQIVLKRATSEMDKYYQLQENVYLENALVDLNKTMLCQETRKKSIELKVSVLVLLTEFKWGENFIDSLNENDFKFPYKKVMNHDYFKALEYENKGDTLSRDKSINKIVDSIDEYIKQKKFSENNFDDDVFYDFLFMKNKIIKGDAFKREIDSIEKKYPFKTKFFELFREGFDDMPKSTSPVGNTP
jgi:hypothetical protein